jgi:hypothetical protein
LKWRTASSLPSLGMFGLVGAAAAFGSTLISYGLNRNGPDGTVRTIGGDQ